MPALNNLQQLRKDLYLCFHKRKDATMNLLDALTSDGNKYKSVVQLIGLWTKEAIKFEIPVSRF